MQGVQLVAVQRKSLQAGLLPQWRSLQTGLLPVLLVLQASTDLHAVLLQVMPVLRLRLQQLSVGRLGAAQRRSL